MAAKGARSKELVMEKILSTFEGSFRFDKELRIPMIEDGEEIQIKVTFTCAKENVSNPNFVGAPTSTSSNVATDAASEAMSKDPVNIVPTVEEKENVKKILEALNF